MTSDDQEVEDVKEFLTNAIRQARREGIGKSTLALFLQRHGISILGVDIKSEDNFRPHLKVQFLTESNEVREAHFDLQEIDGRPMEDIEKEMKNETVQ